MTHSGLEENTIGMERIRGSLTSRNVSVSDTLCVGSMQSPTFYSDKTIKRFQLLLTINISLS